MSNRTAPSGEPGGIPSGEPAQIRANDDDETRRGTIRQNESASILARAGYNVEQEPAVTGTRKRPDYKIEGQIFDCYAPATSNAYNIVEVIRQKVGKGQTKRIVLNLDDSDVSPEAVRQALASNPISELQEIIALKNGSVTHLFP